MPDYIYEPLSVIIPLTPVFVWLFFAIRMIRHPYKVQKHKLPWIIIRYGLAKLNLDVDYHEFGYRYPVELVRKLGWRHLFTIGVFAFVASVIGIMSLFR